jgi:hypothetical protein
MTSLRVYLSNDNSYVIEMFDVPTSEKLIGMAKHLQQLPLRFRSYDNPYLHSLKTAVPQLLHYAQHFGISVDAGKLQDQTYLNQLHEYYERGYNSDPNWLLYHEAIHIIENVVNNLQHTLSVNLTYGELAGPLDKPFDYTELETMRTSFSPGDCYVEFNELGKTPLAYWYNKEPGTLERVCKLAKPMLRLNFKLSVAVFPVNKMPPTEQVSEFTSWFARFKTAWCKHWNIPNWTVEQMVGGIPVGHMIDVERFNRDILAGATPVRLELQ